MRVRVFVAAIFGSPLTVYERSRASEQRSYDTAILNGTAILFCPVRVANSRSFRGPARTRQNGPAIFAAFGMSRLTDGRSPFG